MKGYIKLEAIEQGIAVTTKLQEVSSTERLLFVEAIVSALEITPLELVMVASMQAESEVEPEYRIDFATEEELREFLATTGRGAH